MAVPATERVDDKVTAPLAVTAAKVLAPFTFKVDDKVVAPVTPNVDDNVAAPVTDKVPVEVRDEAVTALKVALLPTYISLQ